VASGRRDTILVRSYIDEEPNRLLRLHSGRGEVSERLKELASKASVGGTLPWVQIPPSPPKFRFCFHSVHGLAVLVYLWRPLRFKKSDRIECPSASHIGTATEKGPDPAAKGELLSWVKTPVVLSMVYAETLLDLEDYGAPTSKEFYALKPGTYSLSAQFNRMPFPRDAFRVQTVGFGRLRLQPAGERSYDMVNPEAGGSPTSNTLQFEVPTR
jgi:hypothetical protein